MVIIQAYREAFGADGGANGIIQVAASNKYWPGTVAYVSATGKSGLKVIILESTDATHIRVRLHPDEGVSSDGRTTRAIPQTPADLTGYTVAAGAAIDVPQQPVFDIPGGGVIPRIPTFW